jgi:hypothetical protein
MARSDPDNERSRHASRNRELVALIERKGGELENPRTIDLHFWSAGRAFAERLVSALCELGMRNVVTGAPQGLEDEWNVEASYRGSVRQVIEPAFVERLILLADGLESRFDGWGTNL